MAERPSIGQAGHDSTGVVQAVRTAKEIESTYRVYRKEWLFDSRHASRAEAVSDYETRLKGRLDEGDWEVRPDPNGRDYVLWVRSWNVAAERKWEDDAEQFAAEQRERGYEVHVVTRNSRAEHVLQQYGTLRLVKADPS